jgi:putative transposase
MLYAYIMALVTLTANQTVLNIACLNGLISHDKLTRALNLHDIGKKLLDLISMPSQLSGGCLIIDDTIIEKPHGQAFEAASYVYSSSKGKAVFGYSLVLLVWTDGIKRIVVDYKIYRKGGPTKLQLALKMLSFARNRLKLKPSFVLFDSWYAAKTLLKRLCDYGWKFVTRLKRNRSFNGVQLQDVRKGSYWNASGELTGRIKVYVVKYDSKYFASNSLSLSRSELLEQYKARQHIEQVNKELKMFGLESCQMRSIKAQTNHVICCIIAYAMVERRAKQLGLSAFKCRQLIISGNEQVCKSDVARLRRAA